MKSLQCKGKRESLFHDLLAGHPCPLSPPSAGRPSRPPLRRRALTGWLWRDSPMGGREDRAQVPLLHTPPDSAQLGRPPPRTPSPLRALRPLKPLHRDHQVDSVSSTTAADTPPAPLLQGVSRKPALRWVTHTRKARGPRLHRGARAGARPGHPWLPRRGARPAPQPRPPGWRVRAAPRTW